MATLTSNIQRRFALIRVWIALIALVISALGAALSGCAEDLSSEQDGATSDPCASDFAPTSCIEASHRVCSTQPDLTATAWPSLSRMVFSHKDANKNSINYGFIDKRNGVISAWEKSDSQFYDTVEGAPDPKSLRGAKWEAEVDSEGRLLAGKIKSVNNYYQGYNNDTDEWHAVIEATYDAQALLDVSLGWGRVPMGLLVSAQPTMLLHAWDAALTEHHPLIAPFVRRSMKMSGLTIWPHPILPPLRPDTDTISEDDAPDDPGKLAFGRALIGEFKLVYREDQGVTVADIWQGGNAPSKQARIRRGEGVESVDFVKLSYQEGVEASLEAVADYTLDDTGEPSGLTLQDAVGATLWITSRVNTDTPDADAPPLATRQLTWTASPRQDAPPIQTLRIYIDDQQRLVGVHFASTGPSLLQGGLEEERSFRARIDYASGDVVVLTRDDGLDGSVDLIEALQRAEDGLPMFGITYRRSLCAGVSLGSWDDAGLMTFAIERLALHPCATQLTEGCVAAPYMPLTPPIK